MERELGPHVPAMGRGSKREQPIFLSCLGSWMSCRRGKEGKSDLFEGDVEPPEKKIEQDGDDEHYHRASSFTKLE
jgi:hypothetical protein